MPTINVNDAYILDETGAEVDKVTGLFTKNENATTGEKQMARLNIAAGGSNPNLLDNAYFVGGGSQLGDEVFPINQRGQTSYAGSGYAFDRYIVETYVTATLQATGIRVQTTVLYVGITQRVPVNRIEAGKTYTMSVIVDGTLYYTPFVADGSGNWFSALYIDGLDWYVPMRYTSNYWEVKVINSLGNIDHIVSAVKLELGTVSTLANDAPPDYGTELRKCQYYYRELSATSSIALAAWAYSSNTCTVYNLFGVGNEMRTNSPTIAASGTWQVQTQAGTLINVTSFSKADGGNVFGVNFVASGLTANQPCRIIGSTGAKITFSADL